MTDLKPNLKLSHIRKVAKEFAGQVGATFVENPKKLADFYAREHGRKS